MDGLMVNTEMMYFNLFNMVGSKYDFQLSLDEYSKITGTGPDNAAIVIQNTQNSSILKKK